MDKRSTRSVPDNANIMEPVVALLAVTGLTHRQAYREIFGITCIKTAAVGIVIAVYLLTGLT